MMEWDGMGRDGVEGLTVENSKSRKMSNHSLLAPGMSRFTPPVLILEKFGLPQP